MKSLYEWLKLYYAKTNEYPNSYPGSEFIFDEEHGFCVFIRDNNVLIIGEVCGDGRYWLKFLCNKAKELGCSTLRFWTARNYKAFIRKFGFYYMEIIEGKYVLEMGVI